MDAVLQQLSQFDSSQAPAAPPQQDAVLAQLQSVQNTAKPKMQMIGAAGLPQALQEVQGNFSPLSKFAIGFKSNMIDNPAMRLKQLLSNLTPGDVQGLQANQALQQSSGAATAGGIAGDVAATAPLAGPLYGGGKAVASAVLPKFLAGTLAPTAGAAAVGAGSTLATQPVMPGQTEAGNAGAGAVGGMAADALLRGAGRVVQPIMQSAPVQKLLQSGIVPTMGQAAGGFMGSLENRLSSIPGVGDVISYAQRRPVQELNRAAIQRAAPEVTAIGREGLQQAEASVGRGYDNVLGQITMKTDESFIPHLESFGQNKALMLSAPQRDQFTSFIRNNVEENLGPNGELTGAMAKKIDSLLGQKAASLRGSSVASEREMGNAFQDAQSAFRQQMVKGAPTPEVAARLAALNGKWAQIVRLQRATATAKEGVFTPGQLQGAVKAEDKSVRKGRFAKGQALGQDLSQPAVSVLGDKYPDSGTVGRYLLASAALGGMGGANEYLGGPRYLTALALAPLLYSRAGSRYMLGNLLPRLQPGIAGALRSGAPYASGVGALYNTER